MKIIKLTRGFEVLVDDEDYNYLSQFKWCISRENGYAVRGVGSRKNNHLEFMHHYIMGKKKGFDIDHINRNKLDNRKENLRMVTRSKNMLNTGIKKNNTSGFRGVIFIKTGKRIKRWGARIKINYKLRSLGYFLTKEEAHIEYQKALLKYL